MWDAKTCPWLQEYAMCFIYTCLTFEMTDNTFREQGIAGAADNNYYKMSGKCALVCARGSAGWVSCSITQGWQGPDCSFKKLITSSGSEISATLFSGSFASWLHLVRCIKGNPRQCNLQKCTIACVCWSIKMADVILISSHQSLIIGATRVAFYLG